jgi:hypothetical protein
VYVNSILRVQHKVMSLVTGVTGDTAIVIQNTDNGTLNLTTISNFCDFYFSSSQTGTINMPTSNFQVCTLQPNGAVTWANILQVSRILVPIGTTLRNIMTNSGKGLAIGTDTLFITKTNNLFVNVSFEDWNVSNQGIVSTLFLPTRVAIEGKNFSVQVQMQTSSQDPQCLIPITTATWGNITIPYQLIPTFESSTQDPSDKEILSSISPSLTFNPCESITMTTTSNSQFLYVLRTSQLNFAIANGIIIATRPATT